jgi:hypothetical protein
VIASCIDIVAFLKSSETDAMIRLILIAIRVEPEYRSVSRSLLGWGPKGESNASIAARSEVTDFLRWRRSCSCFSACYKMLEF